MKEQNKTILLSSLLKVFPEEKMPKQQFESFSMLKNEKASFQLAFIGEAGKEYQFQIESNLKEHIKSYYVEMIPAGTTIPKPQKRPDDYYLDGKKKEYPELLRPMQKNIFHAKYDGINTLWFEIDGKDILPSGNHKIELQIFENDILLGKESINVEVIDALLPKQDFIFTNWFHSDCLMSYYHFDAFSDEYWRVVKNYVERAVEYGMNCILTPLFTPPLDTKIGGERPTVQLVDVTITNKNQYIFSFDNLEKWISMCQEVGIEYF